MLFRSDMGQGPAGHEKRDPAYVLSRRPEWVTTWMGFDGSLLNELWQWVDYRRNYDLVAIVDLSPGQFGGERPGPFGFDRIMPVASESLNAAGMLDVQTTYYRRWGIWARRASPRASVVLSAMDFLSTRGAVNPVGSAATDLVDVPAGAQAATLWTSKLYFDPGEYRVLFTAVVDLTAQDLRGGQVRSAVCTFEVRRGTAAVASTGLASGDAAAGGLMHQLAAEFGVGRPEAAEPHTFHLSCDGQAAVRLVAARIEAVNRPSAETDLVR